jgi:hypothetical protein
MEAEDANLPAFRQRLHLGLWTVPFGTWSTGRDGAMPPGFPDNGAGGIIAFHPCSCELV